MADLFRGEFQSKIICTTCGSIRTTNEPFLTLSLPIVKEKSKLVLHPLLQFPGNPFSTKRLSLTLKESDVGMGKTKDVLLAAGVDAEAHIVYAICDPEKVYSLSVNRLGEIAEEKARSYDKELFIVPLPRENDLLLTLVVSELQPSLNRNFPIRSRLCPVRILPLELPDDAVLPGRDIHLKIVSAFSSLVPEARVLLDPEDDYLGFFFEGKQQVLSKQAPVALPSDQQNGHSSPPLSDQTDAAQSSENTSYP